MQPGSREPQATRHKTGDSKDGKVPPWRLGECSLCSMTGSREFPELGLPMRFGSARGRPHPVEQVALISWLAWSTCRMATASRDNDGKRIHSERFCSKRAKPKAGHHLASNHRGRGPTRLSPGGSAQPRMDQRLGGASVAHNDPHQDSGGLPQKQGLDACGIDHRAAKKPTSHQDTCGRFRVPLIAEHEAGIESAHDPRRNA